jgi:hypothetical protein
VRYVGGGRRAVTCGRIGQGRLAALRLRGARAQDWVDKVERSAGRAFGCLLFALATVDRLEYLARGAAFGAYVFAAVRAALTRGRVLRGRAIVVAARLSASGYIKSSSHV